MLTSLYNMAPKLIREVGSSAAYWAIRDLQTGYSFNSYFIALCETVDISILLVGTNLSSLM